MSTDNSLFNSTEQESNASEETPQEQEQATSPETGGEQQEQSQTGSFDQLLSGIKSADGRQKYSSVEDALRSLSHAQEHIRTLEQENKGYKDQMAKLDEMSEKLSRYEELLARGASSQDSQSDNSGKGLDEASVDKLIEQRLTRKEQEKLAQQNGQLVVSKLTEQYGSREAAEAEFAKKAQELEVSPDFLTDLAYKSPKAVLSYFGTKASSAPSKPQGNVNTTNFQKEEPVTKSHKLYGNTGDLVSNWRASADNVKRKNGLE